GEAGSPAARQPARARGVARRAPGQRRRAPRQCRRLTALCRDDAKRPRWIRHAGRRGRRGVVRRTTPNCVASEPQGSAVSHFLGSGKFRERAGSVKQSAEENRMPADSYVYECNRCGERIEAPRPIFDKSLCAQTSPSGARCLGHLELIESEAAISSGRGGSPRPPFQGGETGTGGKPPPPPPPRSEPPAGSRPPQRPAPP